MGYKQTEFDIFPLIGATCFAKIIFQDLLVVY